MFWPQTKRICSWHTNWSHQVAVVAWEGGATCWQHLGLVPLPLGTGGRGHNSLSSGLSHYLPRFREDVPRVPLFLGWPAKFTKAPLKGRRCDFPLSAVAGPDRAALITCAQAELPWKVPCLSARPMGQSRALQSHTARVPTPGTVAPCRSWGKGHRRCVVHFPSTQRNRRDHTGGDLGRGGAGGSKTTVPGSGCYLEADNWAPCPCPFFAYRPKTETKNHRIKQLNASNRKEKKEKKKQVGEKRKKGKP